MARALVVGGGSYVVVTGGGGGGGGASLMGGGGASLVGGGATVGDGSALGGGGGSGLGDGSCELRGGGGGTVAVLLGNVGARLLVLVNENATPPIATIETSAASPKNSCGRRFPRCETSSGWTFGSCISCEGVARLWSSS